MIGLINILGILIGTYFLLKSYLLVKKKEEDIQQFIFWSILGISIIFIAIYPDILNFFIRILNVKERINAIFTLAILILFIILFNLNIQIKKMEQKISKLDEKIALTNYKLEYKREKNEKD